VETVFTFFPIGAYPITLAANAQFPFLNGLKIVYAIHYVS